MTASAEKTLPIVRVSLFIFMFLWAAEKLMRPEGYQGIFRSFYGLDLGVMPIYAIGIAQILLLVAFVAGVYRTFTYGAVFAMSAASLFVSYRQILFLYTDQGNLLFVASIPVAAASLLLFLMRDQDNWLTLQRKPQPHAEAA